MAAEKDKGASGAASAEIGKYLDILAKDPNSRVFAPLAEAYRKAGLLDDAIETALEGLKVHPNYLGGRVALGRAYFERRQYAEAAAEMQKVVAAASDNIVAHKVLGQIHFAKGDLPSAAKSFGMVLLLDPRDAEAKQFMANIGTGAERPAAPAAAPAPTPPPEAPVRPFAPGPAPAAVPERPAPAAAPPPAPPPPPSMEALTDLAIDDFSLEPPEPAPPQLVVPSAPPAPSTREEMEFAIPGFDELEAAPPAAAVPPAVVPARQPAPVEPPGGMELEVFSRVPWGGERAESPAEPGEPAPGPAPAAPPAGEPGGPSPFEVFGRPKRGGPPVSTKGEREAYQEIELEPTAHAPVDVEPAKEGDSPFEVFTREPRGVPAAAGGRVGRGTGGAFGDIEIETTAYALPETQPSDFGAVAAPAAAGETAQAEAVFAPAAGLDLQLDVGADVGPPGPGEQTGAVADAGPPAPEEPIDVGMHLDFEPESTELAPVSAGDAFAAPAVAATRPGWESDALPEAEDLGVELPPAYAAPGPEPEAEVEPEFASEPEPELASERGREPEEPLDAGGGFAPVYEVPESEGEPPLDLPSIDVAGETEEETYGTALAGPGADGAEDAEDAEEPEEQGQQEASRGVFDTETLASIYLKQGFHGRAADIYRRLVSQRPDDPALRAKLDEVLALERAQGTAAGFAEPVVPPAPAAAGTPAPGGREETLRRLNTLLEAFRGGAPR